MKALLLPWALLVLSADRFAGDGYDDAMLAVQAGRFDAAAQYLRDMPEGPRRDEGWVRLYLAAGELGSAYQASSVAIENHPDQADLLYQAGRAALWLAAGQPAVDRAARLDATIAVLPGLDPSQRAQWRAVAADFRAQGQTILDREARRAAAERRGRWTSLAILAASVTALLVLALRRGRGAPS